MLPKNPINMRFFFLDLHSPGLQQNCRFGSTQLILILKRTVGWEIFLKLCRAGNTQPLGDRIRSIPQNFRRDLKFSKPSKFWKSVSRVKSYIMKRDGHRFFFITNFFFLQKISAHVSWYNFLSCERIFKNFELPENWDRGANFEVCYSI